MRDVRGSFYLIAGRVAAVLFVFSLTTHEGIEGLRHYFRIDPVRGCFLLVLWLLSFASVLYIAFVPRWKVRLIYGVLICFAALCSDIYFSISGDQLDIDSFSVGWQVKYHLLAFLQTYWADCIWPMTKALFLMVLLLLPPFLPSLGARSFVFFPLVPLLMVSALLYRTQGFVIKGVPAAYSAIGVTTLYFIGGSFPQRDTIDMQPVTPPRIKNIVLFIDESLRGDYLDINRDRGTTPYLKSLESKLVNFGIASAGNNCSEASNALMRMGADPRKIVNNHQEDIRKNPTIWSYAAKAGFQTTYIDCQRRHGELHSFMNAEERSLIDNFLQMKERKTKRDIEAAREITLLLRTPERHLIIVNKEGAHPPYATQYPPDAIKFLPLGVETPRETLVREYMNAVYWSVDVFHEEFLKEADLSETLILYTGDHGQNLLDDGKAITHCRSLDPIVQEAGVPLFALSSNQALLSSLRAVSEKNFNRTMHFHIFPTILVLLGYEPSEVERKYYKSLFDEAGDPQVFTSGGIFNFLGKKTTWHPFIYNSDW